MKGASAGGKVEERERKKEREEERERMWLLAS